MSTLVTTATTTAAKPLTARPSARFPVLHQLRFELRVFLRNPQGVFFTLALPVMLLVIFASVFGHGRVPVAGGSVSVAAYYVPGIIAMAIVSASFGNLAAAVVGAREAGVYKRRRATPVSAVTLIAGRALLAVAVAVVTSLVLVAIGYGYGASPSLAAAPVLVLDVALGSLAFACVGYALASLVGSRDAVQPIVMGITLPLYFISGIYVTTAALPHWLLDVAGIFPVRHLASALLAAYGPHAATGPQWHDLAVIAIWGSVGLIIAVRRFSWLPRRG